jgi:Ala-tRNA(Pro) deacylase
MRGTYVAFASTDIAERLAGSVTGTVLPFTFNPELELVADPSLLENDELYFNAARLDRSMVLKTTDYVAVAKPRLGRIVESRGAWPEVTSRIEGVARPT